MAKIPVEKKQGTPWFLWLLGLLLAGALVWGLVEVLNDDAEIAEGVEPVPEVVEPIEPMTEPEGATGTITSLETLLDSNDPSSMVGQRVNISGVTATAVSGDSTYWIANPDEGIQERVFVVLHGLGESQPGPGTGTDGKFNIDQSETMQVQGTVQAVQPSDPDAWGITGNEARELREYQVYIRATSLDNVADEEPIAQR